MVANPMIAFRVQPKQGKRLKELAEEIELSPSMIARLLVTEALKDPNILASIRP